MNVLGKLSVAAVVVFVALQAVRPGIPAKPATAEFEAPQEVRQIINKNCYSCHSDERRLSWFDQIVPGYWLVRHDILTARHHLNFYTLGSKPAAAQRASLYESVNMIQLGAMPLPSFLMLHPEARVTPEELAALKTYLSPWTSRPEPAPAVGLEAASTPASLAAVSPELNGFPFDPAFEKWRPISFTDRGDNNTFRFILGNDIAIKAAQSGNLSPWPDGTRFAKIAWEQQLGAKGLIEPGKFVQVELMLKDASRYKETQGWGWGRWRGLDLKPYGADAHFVDECTGCHQPLRGNDYVYTLPLTSATVKGGEVVNAGAAALPASLPFQPIAWRAITMYVDPQTRTMSTLFGNDAAMNSVDARRPRYAAGTVLALVTWAQREDPHWFGARIPGVPQSVEFVQSTPAGQSGYRRFGGSGFIEEHPDASVVTARTSFVLGLAPARLP
jgi:mono/diheme cytochrome c family protein